MSSLGDWLDAMVKLRAQKAQVAEYNATQQAQGMEALGQGIGGFLGNLGQGIQKNRPTQQDLIANRMMNMATPPRAVPVNPALASAAPTTLEGQVPYSDIPITAQPFTGGKAGFEMANTLDKSAIQEERARQSGELGTARIANYASMADARDLKSTLDQERLDRLKQNDIFNQQIKEQKTANDLTARAATSMKNTTDKYRDKVKETTAYNNEVARATHSMATAKTDEDWQKNVDMLTNHYNAIDSMGYKLPFPEIPPSPSQRKAAQAATTAAGNLVPTTGGDFPYWHPFAGSSQADIDKAKSAAAAMPGSYQYPGIQDYQRANPGEPPSSNLQDYMAQPGPSQAASQGPAPSAAAPEGITVTNEQGVKMKKVNGKWVVVQ